MSAVATRMISTEKRARIVELAKDGWSMERIAADPGVKLGSRQAVHWHLKAWFEETRPDAEATEELRLMQWRRLEDLIEVLRPRTMGPLMGMFGPVRDAETKEFIIVPQPQVIDRLLKVYERQAKLMGLDLTQQIQIGINVSAEALAELFADHAGSPVIEGTAIEIEAGDADA